MSKKRIFQWICGLTLCTVIIFAALPLPQKLLIPSSHPPLQILDRNGTLLYEVRNPAYGAQKILLYEDIPEDIVNILIAAEDRTFRTHIGVSIRGIVRAFVQNLRTGRIVSGGSTITQQVVKTRLAWQRRGWLTKGLEALLAVKLDLAMTKNEILEAYLNEAYFGHRAYGIAAAADTYFGKSVHELSKAEIALLIGLLQSPSRYDPFTNREEALERRRVVLRVMRETGIITEEEEKEYVDEPMTLARDQTDILAPHFVMWIQNRESDKLPQTETSIRTTIDAALERQVEDIVRYQLERLAEKNVTSAAVVVIDVNTGELLAMVGSGDYFDEEHDGQVNVAISPRQPGSALKPFTYALALEDGDTAATIVADTDVQMLTQEGNPYTPRNYDYEEHGLVRYREALANSYNIAAVKVAEKVGVDRILRLLSDAGITTLTKKPEFYGVALTLGDGEVSLLELTTAYGIFARGGRPLSLRTTLEHEENLPQSERPIISHTIAWLITNILSDASARVPEFGLGNLLEFNYQVAAKTGTTRNARDNWVIGYTPDRLVGVWVGNADNSPMKGTSGITGAGPIFHDVMELAMKNLPRREFPMPPEIIQKEICISTGKLPSAACTRTMREYFVAGTEPTDVAAEETNGQEWVEIVEPGIGDRYLLDPLVPDSNEKIILQARTSSKNLKVHWSINYAEVGVGTWPDYTLQWQPTEGEWIIRAVAGGATDEVKIRVGKRLPM